VRVVLDFFGGQSLDIAWPIGQIVVTIMAACAEIAANAIAERTRSRAQWAKAQGLAYIGNAWGGQIVNPVDRGLARNSFPQHLACVRSCCHNRRY